MVAREDNMDLDPLGYLETPVKPGTLSDLALKLQDSYAVLDELCNHLLNTYSRERLDITVIHNLARFNQQNVEYFQNSLNSNIDLLAWSVRRLLETNLTVRFVFQNPQNLQSFIGWSKHDMVDLLESFRVLADSKELQATIKRYREVAKQTPKKLNTRQLSKAVGSEKEYDAMFKLYSKYVHPTSYYLNTSLAKHYESKVRELFCVNGQNYILDTERRLIDEVNRKQLTERE